MGVYDNNHYVHNSKIDGPQVGYFIFIDHFCLKLADFCFSSWLAVVVMVIVLVDSQVTMYMLFYL